MMNVYNNNVLNQEYCIYIKDSDYIFIIEKYLYYLHYIKFTYFYYFSLVFDKQ